MTYTINHLTILEWYMIYFKLLILCILDQYIQFVVLSAQY